MHKMPKLRWLINYSYFFTYNMNIKESICHLPFILLYFSLPDSIFHFCLMQLSFCVFFLLLQALITSGLDN